MLAAQVAQLHWGAKRKGRVAPKNKSRLWSRMAQRKLTVLHQHPTGLRQRPRAVTVSRAQVLLEVLKREPLWSVCWRRKTSSCL